MFKKIVLFSFIFLSLNILAITESNGLAEGEKDFKTLMALTDHYPVDKILVVKHQGGSRKLFILRNLDNNNLESQRALLEEFQTQGVRFYTNFSESPESLDAQGIAVEGFSFYVHLKTDSTNEFINVHTHEKVLIDPFHKVIQTIENNQRVLFIFRGSKVHYFDHYGKLQTGVSLGFIDKDGFLNIRGPRGELLTTTQNTVFLPSYFSKASFGFLKKSKRQIKDRVIGFNPILKSWIEAANFSPNAFAPYLIKIDYLSNVGFFAKRIAKDCIKSLSSFFKK